MVVAAPQGNPFGGPLDQNDLKKLMMMYSQPEPAPPEPDHALNQAIEAEERNVQLGNMLGAGGNLLYNIFNAGNDARAQQEGIRMQQPNFQGLAKAMAGNKLAKLKHERQAKAQAHLEAQKAKRQKIADTFKMKLQQENLKAKQDYNAGKLKQQENESAWRKENAEANRRMQGLMHSGNMAMRQASLDQTAALAKMGHANAAAAREVAQKNRAEDKQQAQIEKFGDTLAPIQKAIADIDAVSGPLGHNIEDLVFDEKKGKVYGKDGKEVDAPGYVIAGDVWSTPGDARATSYKAAFQTLTNNYLKEMSGAAVSNQEMARVKTAWGLAQTTGSEYNMLKALSLYRKAMIKASKNAQARYKKSTVKEYQNRGGAVPGAEKPKAKKAEGAAPTGATRDDALDFETFLGEG